jgi:hypothetical protein
VASQVGSSELFSGAALPRAGIEEVYGAPFYGCGPASPGAWLVS